jgi:hypothetical protein
MMIYSYRQGKNEIETEEDEGDEDKNEKRTSKVMGTKQKKEYKKEKGKSVDASLLFITCSMLASNINHRSFIRSFSVSFLPYLTFLDTTSTNKFNKQTLSSLPSGQLGRWIVLYDDLQSKLQWRRTKGIFFFSQGLEGQGVGIRKQGVGSSRGERNEKHHPESRDAHGHYTDININFSHTDWIENEYKQFRPLLFLADSMTHYTFHTIPHPHHRLHTPRDQYTHRCRKCQQNIFLS